MEHALNDLSIDRNRIAGRAGGTDHSQRRPDERELVNFGIGQRLQIEVFDVPNPTASLVPGVAWNCIAILFSKRLCFVRGGVSALQRDVLGTEVLACAWTIARLACGYIGTNRRALL